MDQDQELEDVFRQLAAENPAESVQAIQDGEPSAYDHRALPYRWGRLQGWCSLIFAPIIFLFLLLSLGRTTVGEGTIIALVSLPSQALMGYGLLHKRRYAYILFWIIGWLGLLQSVDGVFYPLVASTAFGGLIGSVLYLALCGVYYWKRRSEFT